MNHTLLEFLQDNYVIITMIVVLLAILHAPTPVQDNKKVSYTIVSLAFVLTVLTHIELHAMELGCYGMHRIALNVVCYWIKPVIILLFLTYVETIQSWIFKASIALVAVSAILYSTAFFSGIVFTYSVQGEFIRGPLGYTVHIVSTILLAVIFVCTVRKYREGEARYALILAVAAIIIIVSAGIETFDFTRNYLNPAILLGCILHYIYVHIQYANIMNDRQNRKLEEQGQALMISQIQPHFMYNTLNTIYYLCTKNPQLAAATVRNFSGYLRDNLDVGNNAVTLVDINVEISHTKRYTEIEQLRFDNITVHYDLQDEEFDIPPLSIQPMVENAIRHGVRGKKDGRIWVKTFREDGNHVVKIIDNGIGYMRTTSLPDNHSHIGMTNVRERIEKMCNGSFGIEMVKDIGTTVTMKIPAEGKE